MVQAPAWRESAGRIGRRTGAMLTGLGVLTVALALAFALASYHQSDPSWNTAAEGPARNLLGGVGAWVADALLMTLGLPATLLVPLFIFTGFRLWRGVAVTHWGRSLLIVIIGAAITSIGFALLHSAILDTLPAGLGGAIGLFAATGIDALVALIPLPAGAKAARILIMLLFTIAGLWVWLKGIGLDATERSWFASLRVRGSPSAAFDDDNHRIDVVQPPAQVAEVLKSARSVAVAEEAPRPVISEPARNSDKPRPPRERQTKLDLRDTYTLPALDLLKPPPPSSGPAIDKAALERNARLLESVLDDFHVKGHIVEVRPGPVVTMYELEPAAGIKASRVIALADDIARNMSALSARVATIPGRSVIGIELPNAKRESVALSELIGSETYEDQTAQLPLVLGKNIAGDPVIADLAPMPHLLVAGTTGSGKSVGLNCMILSLLYRLTPEQCRMIMIDPKMLELSIYDDIPHLLSPVVTEPQKAIRALKWAVEQMEERYRMMASVGVRGLASFNDKVRAARAKGQPLGRKVQTGYDAETGQPLYEEEKLEYDVLPQIVVIVDELADLMMTAGKEVEFLIQRLAQKARAAGIHLIMATQRPSVDVITGVIKANLPTRISFQVTSKIDSRTILGEQGAEQLLGKGDMLYMPGGKQIARVHGPFVSDEEVRAIADHWRAQGQPDYIHAVTEEPEDGGWEMEGAPSGPDDPETQLYRRAVQLVVENRKASTSWLQRQLRVGYNSAARLIERMEKADIISQPDHVGRREVEIDVADLPRFLGG
jgi:S-DNA-T family DNA segregation ATPase FtsK/SpoIIIE